MDLRRAPLTGHRTVVRPGPLPDMIFHTVRGAHSVLGRVRNEPSSPSIRVQEAEGAETRNNISDRVRDKHVALER